MTSEWRYCDDCRWPFWNRPSHDDILCGTCCRERGMAPSTPDTERIDAIIRAARRTYEMKGAY